MDVTSLNNVNLSTGLTSSATGQTTSTASTKTKSNNSVSTDQFLQLLVAQLKNQDPLDPVKNTDFLAQLASFSSLEQLIAIKTGVDQLAGITTDGSTTDTTSQTTS